MRTDPPQITTPTTPCTDSPYPPKIKTIRSNYPTRGNHVPLLKPPLMQGSIETTPSATIPLANYVSHACAQVSRGARRGEKGVGGVVGNGVGRLQLTTLCFKLRKNFMRVLNKIFSFWGLFLRWWVLFMVRSGICLYRVCADI